MYETLQDLLDARARGELPPGFTLVLDNDSVDGFSGDDQLYDSDPHEMLRELLSYVDLAYQEA